MGLTQPPRPDPPPGTRGLRRVSVLIVETATGRIQGLRDGDVCVFRGRVDAFAGTGPAAWSLSEAMQDAWCAFARSGDPGWPTYERRRQATMTFGARRQVVDDPGADERRA